ncbi:hypothetical protein ACFX1R_004495 [Malus domestica]
MVEIILGRLGLLGKPREQAGLQEWASQWKQAGAARVGCSTGVGWAIGVGYPSGTSWAIRVGYSAETG